MQCSTPCELRGCMNLVRGMQRAAARPRQSGRLVTRDGMEQDSSVGTLGMPGWIQRGPSCYTHLPKS